MPASDRERSTPTFTATAGASGGGNVPVASAGTAGPRAFVPAAEVASALPVGAAALAGAEGALVGAGPAAVGAAVGAAPEPPPQATNKISATSAAAGWGTRIESLLRMSGRRPVRPNGSAPTLTVAHQTISSPATRCTAGRSAPAARYTGTNWETPHPSIPAPSPGNGAPALPAAAPPTRSA